MATTPLSPSQQRALAALRRGIERGGVCVLMGAVGSGKTTVLTELQELTSALTVTAKEFPDALRDHHPLSLDENISRQIGRAMDSREVTIVDDLGPLWDVVGPRSESFPRRGMLNLLLKGVLIRAAESGKKLVFSCVNSAPDCLIDEGYCFTIPRFTVDDYRFICRAHLPPEVAERLDFAELHKLAPGLSGYHLRKGCRWLRDDPALTTARLADYLLQQSGTRAASKPPPPPPTTP
jgi:energy-coupling factor transporter ATP-binding protein EcfA2